MAKQNFLGLVKIEGKQTAAYNGLATAGKLVFAHLWDSEAEGGAKVNERFIINANGVEYNIATAEVFKSLEERVKSLEDWKGIVDTSIANLVEKDDKIDESIAALDASVKKHEERLTTTETSVGTLEAWRSHIDNVSVGKLDTSVKNHETRIKALEDASTALAGRIADVSQDVIDISNYVHTTVNASIDVLQAKDTEIDGSIGDISARLSNVGIAAADNKLTVNGKNVTLSGSDYVTVTADNNKVDVSLNAEKIQDGGTAEGHEKLATKGYVDAQIAVLEQALVFIGDISTGNVTAELTNKEVKAGYTYVATDAGEYGGQKFEAGDLIIVKADAEAGTAAKIIVVERNLDGAVTAGAPLDSSKLVVGVGTQGIKTIDVTAEDLAAAIANANSAIQGVKAATTQNDYVKISVENSTDPSTKDVSAVLSVVNTSVALDGVTSTGSLVDAKAVKDLVDAKAADIKVKATLNSSTTDYVDAAAVVDEAGRVISASVGVKVATLVDASNGTDGLATAMDVYNELTDVEQTMAEANTQMSKTIGLNSNYSVTWSAESGIAKDTSIVKAIEEVAKKAEDAKQSGVTEFGGATGKISVDTANTTNGAVKFAMDGSTLKGSVNGWSGLVDRVTAAETSIGDVSTRVNEVSIRLEDLSTYVHETVDASIDALQAKDVEIDASIDRLDSSVSALETWQKGNTFVNTVEGEAITADANTTFVYVNANPTSGNVKLTSGVVLANNTYGSTAATGLATDAFVNDFLAWEVIGDN